MKIETHEIVFTRKVRYSNDRYDWEEDEECTLKDWMNEKDEKIKMLKREIADLTK